jgi:hypothetical protein
MFRVATVVATASSMLLLGCTRDDNSIKERLDKIDNRLAGIEARLGRGGAPGAAAQQANRAPQGPDPREVYAVDIEGAAFEGAENAKVTVVEAFEFA